MAPRFHLIDADSGEVVLADLELATTFWRRFRGLQFRRELSPNAGLYLFPCHAVHTHWLRFALDIAMLDADGRVLACHQAVPPWRILAGPRGTRAVVEAAATPNARWTLGRRLLPVPKPTRAV